MGFGFKKCQQCSNFWEDWKTILENNHMIKKFELCDFIPIHGWAQTEKERKKNMSTELI
jgi:DNA topoisomerase-1